MAEQLTGGSSALSMHNLYPLAAVIPLADIMREQEADTVQEIVPPKQKETPHDKNGKQQRQQKRDSQQGKQPKKPKQHKSKKDKAARPSFDPASFAPKILAKRTEQPADSQQPPQQQQQPASSPAPSASPANSERSLIDSSKGGERSMVVGERTLFVPSPAFSTAAKREQRDLTAPKASHRRTDPSRPHNSRTPAVRTTSPAIASGAVAALLTATQPIRIFTPSLRLIHHDQLQALLSDSREFYVVAAIGMQRTGKSHVLNEIIKRQGGWKGFAEGETAAHSAASSLAGQSAVVAGRTAAGSVDGAHSTSGVDVIATPERLFYIDTQPLLSPNVAESLQREERDAVSHIAVVFNAQVAADMFDIQLPLLMLCLTHTLVVTVNWPIPPSFVSHMQLVFDMFSTLSSTLLPRSSHSCHVVLLINRAQETSAESPYSLSPHQLQQQVDTLFASSLASFASSGQVDVFLLPAKERGSLYDSSMRLLAAKLWSLTGRMKSQTGREREREWGRRLSNVYNALVHSSTMREQRKEVEARLSNQRPAQHNTTASVFNQSTNTTPPHHAHSSHSSGQQRGRGSTGRDSSGSSMTVPLSIYQRDTPATSHQKLYQPP